MAIDPRRVYTLILGGGAGTRLHPLTKDRAKPAVPFAGKYRLIDVPISNCLNSGIPHIFVLTQFNSRSLHRHIQQTYRLDHFTHGFVDILAAEQNPRSAEWYQGTADAVRQNLWHLNDPTVTHVLVLSGDQIYRMDYRAIFETHERLEADVTLAVTLKRPEEAGQFGILKIDDNFHVVDFVEKPSEEQLADLIVQGEDLAPLGVTVSGPVVLASMGIYVFANDALRVALDNELDDFGKYIIPWCVKHMRVGVHPFLGYWEDVGTIGAFFQANLAITEWKPLFEFYDEMQPVFTRPRYLPNSKLDDVRLERSIVSDGCFIRRSEIINSVIGVRTLIRCGSRLESVLTLGQDTYSGAMHPVVAPPRCGDCGEPGKFPGGIGHDCHITRAIIDKNSRIGDGVVITDHTGQPDEDGDGYCVRDGIVIVMKNAVIPAGTRI